MLTLEYRGLRAVFEFTDPYEIQINGDPTCNWIQDFYCFRALWNPDYIVFDVGYYHIECKGVRMKSIEQFSEDE